MVEETAPSQRQGMVQNSWVGTQEMVAGVTAGERSLHVAGTNWVGLRAWVLIKSAMRDAGLLLFPQHRKLDYKP